MASTPEGTSTRTIEAVRRDLEAEREQLASATESLRESLDVTSKMRTKLPMVAAASLGAGFVLAGGLGATARLLFRRG